MTRRFSIFRSRAEKFCAKLNDGLTAVAFVLAMAVFMVGTYRTVELLELTATNDASTYGGFAAQSADN